MSGWLLDATTLKRRTLSTSTHHGTSVLDSLWYGLKMLGSGQVPLLSDNLTDKAEGAHETLTAVMVRMGRNQNITAGTELLK